MAKYVEIGHLKFQTQKSALKHYKEILSRYHNGDHIDDSRDHADLVALIERYDSILSEFGEPAKGCDQIDRFERRLNTGKKWKTPGFWLVRQDGSATDFSYIWAVKGQAGDRSKDFYGACRDAVELDLEQAKEKAFSEYSDEFGLVECENTGLMVSIDNARLDYICPPFSQIVCGFRAAKGWSDDFPSDIVSEPADAQTTSKFVDESVADAFRAYHRQRAILRILSKTAKRNSNEQASRLNVARPVKLS